MPPTFHLIRTRTFYASTYRGGITVGSDAQGTSNKPCCGRCSVASLQEYTSQIFEYTSGVSSIICGISRAAYSMRGPPPSSRHLYYLRGLGHPVSIPIPIPIPCRSHADLVLTPWWPIKDEFDHRVPIVEISSSQRILFIPGLHQLERQPQREHSSRQRLHQSCRTVSTATTQERCKSMHFAPHEYYSKLPEYIVASRSCNDNRVGTITTSFRRRMRSDIGTRSSDLATSWVTRFGTNKLRKDGSSHLLFLHFNVHVESHVNLSFPVEGPDVPLHLLDVGCLRTQGEHEPSSCIQQSLSLTRGQRCSLRWSSV